MARAHQRPEPLYDRELLTNARLRRRFVNSPPQSPAPPEPPLERGDGHACFELEKAMTTKTETIRALNDKLRHDFSEGRAVMTTGIAALGAEAVARIVKTIAVYDDFCHTNDPHQEHDFGSFEADGHTIFFKIDYYNKVLEGHSPDPADPSVTERVITIMLAHEY
jgi:hypothetical protein